MNVACVVEGFTEFDCVPTMIGRLGHTVIGRMTLKGTFASWAKTIEEKVVPRAISMALKRPDKLLVVLDREDRGDCIPELASQALRIVNEALQTAQVTCPVCVVVADRCFEAMLFADYESLDRLLILREAVSPSFGDSTDGVNVLSLLKHCLRDGEKYDKKLHGLALARTMRLSNETVLRRNRALRKLVKEFPRQ